MANSIIVTPLFERKYKRLLKKFPLLHGELSLLETTLLENPKTGIELGSNIYKIRLANKNKNKGKSGGFRIVTYLVSKEYNDNEINLITIFDKSEEANITKEEILKIIKNIK